MKNEDNYIVLTGSVVQSYRRLEKGGIQNPKLRLIDYICSIKRWLDQPEIDKVIYCDSSGFHIPEYIFACDRFKSYAVDLRHVALSKGKGPAECQTIEYVMGIDHCLSQNFFKCTGRLFIRNYSSIYNEIDRSSSLFAMMKSDYYADTRFYWLNRNYYQRWIRDHLNEIDDYAGWHIEHFYAEHCREHQAIVEPEFIGRFGHDGSPYLEDYSDDEKKQAGAIIIKHNLM